VGSLCFPTDQESGTDPLLSECDQQTGTSTSSRDRRVVIT